MDMDTGTVVGGSLFIQPNPPGLPVEVVLHAVRPDPLQGVDRRPGPAQSLHPVLPLKLTQSLEK